METIIIKSEPILDILKSYRITQETYWKIASDLNRTGSKLTYHQLAMIIEQHLPGFRGTLFSNLGVEVPITFKDLLEKKGYATNEDMTVLKSLAYIGVGMTPVMLSFILLIYLAQNDLTLQQWIIQSIQNMGIDTPIENILKLFSLKFDFSEMDPSPNANIY